MRRAVGILLLITVAVTGCRKTAPGTDEAAAERFDTDVMNRHTPVKNQGHSSVCWAYAMLSAIETEHIMRGDSVHLSVRYAVRSLLEDNYTRAYLTRGRTTFTTRGMGATLLNVIGRHGLVPYDSYSDRREADIDVLSNKIKRIARAAVNTNPGLERFRSHTDEVLDETLGPAPRRVFMLGAEYTPGEFARSVCAPGEYIGLTSFTHHPFYTRFALEVPDNWEHNELLNLPIDTLMRRMEQAVRHGHGVCWEGDTSEPGFSFARGTARLAPSADLSQAARQRAFERSGTTDDHCMAIVGLARDSHGAKYFIMKNSWGTANPYGGLMFVSYDYVRMKTIAVFMPRSALGKL